MASLIPLIVLLLVVGVGAFIGYSVYLWSSELAERASKKMEEKNMSFTKNGGLRVAVKDMNNEKEADKTQNVLVNVWNNAQFPNYKSSLGWNNSQKKVSTSSASPRPGVARSGSSQLRVNNKTATSTSGSTLSPPERKSSQRRSASPVPGGWE